MSNRAAYVPGAALGAEIEKDGDTWTLVLIRDLNHAPARVWQALTDPAQLREWAPFDADGSLTAGATVKLTTVGAPQLHVTETHVKKADAPRALEYSWGGMNIRWELEARGERGTRLKLWHAIAKGFISMGAAGWHVCFDVLDRYLSGEAIGRTVGPDAMKVDGWQRLLTEYSQQLGVDPPRWG
jgi:uncharacterized protein YndB with AHSA1/START domain